MEGTVKNIFNKEDELYQQRIEICRKCPLIDVDMIFGEVCNSKKWYNPETGKVTTYKVPGSIHGC